MFDAISSYMSLFWNAAIVLVTNYLYSGKYVDLLGMQLSA